MNGCFLGVIMWKWCGKDPSFWKTKNEIHTNVFSWGGDNEERSVQAIRHGCSLGLQACDALVTKSLDLFSCVGPIKSLLKNI